MSELKDWRGTPIEVGSKVIWHGESSWRVGVGTVTKIEHTTKMSGSSWWGPVWVDWHEHRAHDNKKSKPLDIDRITVLTKDLIDD